jgi:hypothetical protein
MIETMAEATQKLRMNSPEILILTDGISRIFDTLINRVEDLGILSEEASVQLEKQMESLVHSIKNTVRSQGMNALNSTRVILAEMQGSVEQFLHDKQFPSVEEISRKMVKLSEQMKGLVNYIDQHKEEHEDADVSDSASRSGFVDETMKIEFSKFLSGAMGSGNKNFTDSRFAEDDKQQPEISPSVHQEVLKQNTELTSKLANSEALRKNDQQVIDLQYRCLEVLQNQVRDLMKLHEEMKAKDVATSPVASLESTSYKQHNKSPSKANLAERFQSKLEQIGEEMDEIEETNKKIQDIQGISFDRKLRVSIDTPEAKGSQENMPRVVEEIITKELDLNESRSELDEAEMKIRATAPVNDIDALFKEAMKGLGLANDLRNQANTKANNASPSKERLSNSSSKSVSQTEKSVNLKPQATPPLNFKKSPSNTKIGQGPPAPIRSVTPRQPIGSEISPLGVNMDRDGLGISRYRTHNHSSSKASKIARSSSSTSDNPPQNGSSFITSTTAPSLTSLIRKEVKSVKTELNLVAAVVVPKTLERNSHKSNQANTMYSPSQYVVSGVSGTQTRPNSKGPNKKLSASQEKALRRSSVMKTEEQEKKGASMRGSFNLERNSVMAGLVHYAKSDYYPGGMGNGGSAVSLQKKDSSLSLSSQAPVSKPPRVPTPDARQNSPKKPILESTGGNYGMSDSLNRRTSLENVSAELRGLKKESLAREVISNLKIGSKVAAVATSHSSLVKGAAGITSFTKVSCQPSTNHVQNKARQFTRSTMEVEPSSQILIHKPKSPKKGTAVARNSFVDNYGFSVRQSQQSDSQAADKNLLRYIDKLQRENADLRECPVGSSNLEAFKLKTENTHLKDAIMMLTGRDAYEFIRPTTTSPPPLREPMSYEELDSDLAFLARSERGSATLPSQSANTGN